VPTESQSILAKVRIPILGYFKRILGYYSSRDKCSREFHNALKLVINLFQEKANIGEVGVLLINLKRTKDAW